MKVPKDLAERVMTQDLWPAGVSVRPFRPKGPRPTQKRGPQQQGRAHRSAPNTRGSRQQKYSRPQQRSSGPANRWSQWSWDEQQQQQERYQSEYYSGHY